MNKILEIRGKVFGVGCEHIRKVVSEGSVGMRRVLGDGRRGLEVSKYLFVGGMGFCVVSVVVVGVGLRYLFLKMDEGKDSASREVFYNRYGRVLKVVFGLCAIVLCMEILFLVLGNLFFLYGRLAGYFWA